MTKSSSYTIYVRLLDEDIEVWRPVESEKIDEENFVILIGVNLPPVTESWEFLPGDIVKCEIRNIGKKYVMAAIKKSS